MRGFSAVRWPGGSSAEVEGLVGWRVICKSVGSSKFLRVGILDGVAVPEKIFRVRVLSEVVGPAELLRIEILAGMSGLAEVWRIGVLSGVS